MVAKNTKIDRSLFLIIPKIPVRKAPVPKPNARSPVTASIGLLKIPCPPRCPKATRIRDVANDKKKKIISITDNFPFLVFGKKVITNSKLVILFYQKIALLATIISQLFFRFLCASRLQGIFHKI